MFSALLSTLLFVHSGPSISGRPDPAPPLAVRSVGPAIRSEAYEVVRAGNEKQLRKKRNKASRERWRQ